MLDRPIVIRAVSWLVVTLIAGSISAGAAERAASTTAVTVFDLMKHDLVNSPGKEVLMLAVSYPAAGASLPHRHDAEVFVYVLEGHVTMQVKGTPAVTLGPGETFYEAPDDVHIVSANASATTPAKILVVMIKVKGTPVSRVVAE